MEKLMDELAKGRKMEKILPKKEFEIRTVCPVFILLSYRLVFLLEAYR